MFGFENFVSSTKPDYVEMVHYLFWRRGIDYNTFIDLPLPYIFSIIMTQKYVNDEEKKSLKKQGKKKSGQYI